MARILVSLMLSLMASRALASFDEALALYHSKDYTAALTEFRRLAEIGDHSAQFNIGVMYYRGESVGADPIQAYAWMALANQGGDPAWTKMRDQVYAGLPEAQKAVADAAKKDLFARLSDQSLAAQLAPVLPSAEGNYRPARAKKRVAPPYPVSMRREGRVGWVDVVYAVGVDGTTRLHDIVWSTHADFALVAVEALKRFQYEPARLNGKPMEEYGLRLRFVFKLKGAELDQVVAQREIDDLREKADKGGATDAYRYAAALELLSNFTKIPENAGNPNQWYWTAAARGNARAQFSLGNNLLYGNACTPDARKGLAWLQRAAEAGQGEAQYVLAIEMLSGARLAPDRDAALKWLERAANGDFAAAKLKLAWLYATSPDEKVRNPSAAQNYLKQIQDKFIDQLSLLEVRAAVAAASGDFQSAARLQQKAIDEATRYELPTETLEPKLKAYREGKAWVEVARVEPGGSMRLSSPE
jgi:TPR repeat protein